MAHEPFGRRLNAILKYAGASLSIAMLAALPGVAHADVCKRLRNTFGEQADVLVLEAEICRRELLLEIEAIALRPAAQL